MAQRIEATLTITYGEQTITEQVSVPIDSGQPWMDLSSGVVSLTSAARDALFDLVDRDRRKQTSEAGVR